MEGAVGRDAMPRLVGESASGRLAMTRGIVFVVSKDDVHNWHRCAFFFLAAYLCAELKVERFFFFMSVTEQRLSPTATASRPATGLEEAGRALA